jgi:16S rRNA (cytidine1402-2'-O)-methyltransferase
LDAGHTVVPIPGPSAVLAALAGSGLPLDRFCFLGFPPRKGPERAALLERVARAPETVVLFESPERLEALLEALGDLCGGARRGVVGRELTKLHEEFLRGSLEQLLNHVRAAPPRGEITLVLEGAAAGTGSHAPADEGSALALARTLLQEGMSPSQAAREVAARAGLPRNHAYRLVQSLPGRRADGS